MENATKALLIAAAVLIAVLLISLVMGVLNSGAEQVDNADLSEYEIQQFNDKFNKYVEENK
jgi:type III secretory pathway component EscT